MRLQVFLSHNGVASRRKAMTIIQEGRVRVNETVISEPSFDVDPKKDRVFVDEKRIGVKRHQYIMLNKPKGYLTTKADAHAEKTVYDLLPPKYHHLSPVGRLDKDTEGLLLFTNDGEMLYRLTHPKFNLDKVYHVEVRGVLDEKAKQKIEKGIYVGPQKTAPAQFRNVRRKKISTEFFLTIHEGKKRQIRIMFAIFKLPVMYLQRVAHGPIKLKQLALGYHRELTSDEIGQLQGIE